MCVRFDQEFGMVIRWSKSVGAWIPEEDWVEGLDTFPGYQCPVLIPDWSRRVRDLARAQYGMVPFWAKDAAFGRKNAYNARSETLLDRPTFREAFRKRRCVVPVTSFYEREAGRWVRFRSTDEALTLAGLFEPANDLCTVPSFAIVTTVPNEQVEPVQDRMPVVLNAEGVERWLGCETDVSELQSLCVPCPCEWTAREDAGPIGRKAAKEARLLDL